jgi:hypothetical protein
VTLTNKAPSWIFYFLLALLTLLGMLALWRSTPYGVGLVNDSASYIEGADNLLAGKGYVRTSGSGELKPITHFPPLFSLLLAAISLTGLELLPAARLVVILLFGATILLTGLSVYRLCGSRTFAILGAFLLATSDVFLGVYSMALSEALFMPLMLAAFLVLTRGFERFSPKWLAFAGVILSLATLTRYGGVSLYMTAVLAVVLIHRSQQIPPWKGLGALLAGGVPLPVVWALYTRLAFGSESVGNRLVSWHPPAMPKLFEAAKNLLTWLAPHGLLSAQPFFGRLLSLLSLLVLPMLLTGLIWCAWRRRTPPASDSPALAVSLALQVLTYLGFLVVSLSLFDASTPLNERILSVAYLPMLVLFAGGLGWTWNWLNKYFPKWRWALVLLPLLVAAFSLADGLSAVRQLGAEGQGFSHSGWQESPAIQSVRGLPPVIIYSNKPTAIYLLADKSAYIVPTPEDAVTGKTRPGFAADLQVMQQRVLNGQAVLVLFGLRDSADPEEAALYNALSTGLPVLADYGDAVILGRVP